MSVWMEIHCDLRRPSKRYGDVCFTDRGDNVGYMLQTPSVNGLLHGYHWLEKAALEIGWEYDKKSTNWKCPRCKSMDAEI